jgi:molecular chaperone DnaK
MKYFGIDLGTSTCSVSYAVNSPKPNVISRPTTVNFRVGGHEQFLGTKSPAVPSVVAVLGSGGSGQGAKLFGFEAEHDVEKGQVRGRSYQAVFRSVKSHLGTGRSYVHADRSLNTPVKVWADLIRRLCEMTVAEKGKEFDPRQHPTVLTVPASFRKAQRDDTIEAARLAGFNVAKEADLVHLIDEPVAALIDTINHPDSELYIKPERENTVLVFDFGGGTCDLVVLKIRYDASEPTGIAIRPQAISPYQQMGGDTIDLAIMEKVVWPRVCQQNGFKRDQLTASDRKQIEDQLRYGVCRKLKESVNERLRSIEDEQFGRKDWAGIVEIMPLPAGIRYSENKDIRGDAKLSAQELYEVMLPFLELEPAFGQFVVGESNNCIPFTKLIESTMERAGLTPDTLDLLVLHGGSCKSPFIRWAGPFDSLGTGFGRCYREAGQVHGGYS